MNMAIGCGNRKIPSFTNAPFPLQATAHIEKQIEKQAEKTKPNFEEFLAANNQAIEELVKQKSSTPENPEAAIILYEHDKKLIFVVIVNKNNLCPMSAHVVDEDSKLGKELTPQEMACAGNPCPQINPTSYFWENLFQNGKILGLSRYPRLPKN